MEGNIPSSSICFSLLPHGFEQAYEESMDQNIRKQKEIINWLNKNSDLIYRDDPSFPSIGHSNQKQQYSLVLPPTALKLTPEFLFGP